MHLVYTMKFIKLVHGFSASYSNSRGKKKTHLAEVKCVLLIYKQALKSSLKFHLSSTPVKPEEERKQTNKQKHLSEPHLRQGRGSLSSSSSSSSASSASSLRDSSGYSSSSGSASSASAVVRVVTGLCQARRKVWLLNFTP